VRVALTSVYVRDVDAAYKFYTDVLGFVEKERVPGAPLAVVVSPEAPDGPALLLEPNGNPFGVPPVVFAVDDVRRECERLKRLGVVFRQDPIETDWGVHAIFDDTCGNLVELREGRAAV
jgi:catechol 2,3-dioxygenase-like lactoylglutathione lyase family enzyme